MNVNMKRETAEAIAAGERALSSLRAARDALGSARNWGIFSLMAWWQIIWCSLESQRQEGRLKMR